MKIYIVFEGKCDRFIRAVTGEEEVAKKLCEMFHKLDLFIEDYETVGTEYLQTLLRLKSSKPQIIRDII